MRSDVADGGNDGPIGGGQTRRASPHVNAPLFANRSNAPLAIRWGVTPFFAGSHWRCTRLRMQASRLHRSLHSTLIGACTAR